MTNKAVNWHTLSHEQYFSIHCFLDTIPESLTFKIT